jgi:predicted methyltransferase
MALSGAGLLRGLGLPRAATGALAATGLFASSATAAAGPDDAPLDAQALARLDAACRAPTRSVANRARDGARHPAETLAFFGLQPQHTVLEIAPGGGWYTEILAPYLQPEGRLLLVPESAEAPDDYRRQGRARLVAKLQADPAHYGRVELAALPTGPGQGITLAPPAEGRPTQTDGRPTQADRMQADRLQADRVLTFRNLHNWLEDGRIEGLMRSFFTLLAPGGVLGVEEHRARPGTSRADCIASGYLTEALVVELAAAAGFVLDARSEVNANPRDSKDHPHGVWSLPPTLRGGELERARFLAIGESDRMTLRFRKPRA